MDPILLLFAIGFVIPVGIVAMFVRQKKKTRARIKAIEAKGWRTNRLKNGFRVDGDSDGIPWTLTLKTSNKRNNSGRRAVTIWEAPAEPIDEVVLFGPKLPPIMTQLNFGGSLVQMALKFLLGDDAEDLVNIQEINGVGSDEFQRQFTVLATTQASAEALIVPNLEKQMFLAKAHFGEPLIVLRWRDRIQVRLQKGTWEIDQMEALIGVGIEAAENAGYGS